MADPEWKAQADRVCQQKSTPCLCNHGITELEMPGLLYNMNMWKYYLGKKDFDAAVDHAAIPI